MIESAGGKRTTPTWKQRKLDKLTRSFVFSKSTQETPTSPLILTLLVMLIGGAASCSSITQRRDVRPLVMRDVPAQRLAYRFEPDVVVSQEITNDEPNDKIETIQLDFSTRRQDDALIRTVRSPDGQRALTLYSTPDEPSQAFRIDLYSADGNFLRNLTPPDIACVFPETVSWSPDGNFITFIAHKAPAKPTPTPTPVVTLEPEPATEATPLPSVAPAFPAVAAFNTEQVYICNRDGYDLKPLTSREGLIYFYSAWAPDGHALAAMACRESEWEAREKDYKLPTGRPRLIHMDGKERLLDDELTEALPVWSPDSSKVATAFDTDVMIYDAATEKPTQARIRLREPLIAASRAFEAKTSGKRGESNTDSSGVSQEGGTPASFNPIVRLEWPTPEKLYLQTAYVRLLPNEPISTFQRWHLVILSPQAAVLK